MKQRKDWKIVYQDWRFLRWNRWIPPYTFTQEQFNNHTISWETAEVKVAGRWIKSIIPVYRITCINNNWYFTYKYKYYRRPRTTQEKSRNKQDSKEFHHEDLKVSYRERLLPNSRESYHIGTHRSWKKSHKCRKQWMKNL